MARRKNVLRFMLCWFFGGVRTAAIRSRRRYILTTGGRLMMDGRKRDELDDSARRSVSSYGFMMDVIYATLIWNNLHYVENAYNGCMP